MALKAQFSIFVTVLGLTLFVLPVVFHLFNNFIFTLHLRSSKTSKVTSGILEPIKIAPELTNINEVVGDFPNRILIPSLKIDLEVKPSRVVGGLWEIHEDTANFGIGSALPQDSGNTVIFAHARYNLFAPLRKIKKEEIVSIQTKNGKWYTFTVVDKKEVNPTQVEVVSQTPDKTLTLFTCSGFFDSKRLIIVAKERS